MMATFGLGVVIVNLNWPATPFLQEKHESGLPSRVEALIGEEIIKVSLGWGHALALTKHGKLFRWGYYADGRLGKVGNSFEVSPLDSGASEPSAGETSGPMFRIAEKLVREVIDKEKDMPILWEPSLKEEGMAPAVTTNGQGPKAAEMVTVVSFTIELKPCFIEALEGLEVLQVVAGFDHSLVLVAE
ncbi:hypothetical protein Leryth_012749 [Lithospermum erythrorhizon]|nr:hypothetical protein Leryth_012749 [Lithospermum erythrorhizon]